MWINLSWFDFRTTANYSLVIWIVDRLKRTVIAQTLEYGSLSQVNAQPKPFLPIMEKKLPKFFASFVNYGAQRFKTLI